MTRLVSQPEAVYRYSKGLRRKLLSGFKYSENPKDASVLEAKRREIDQRLAEIDARQTMLAELEQRVDGIEPTAEDLDRRVNSDAKWMELCASTIAKSERLIKTLQEQEINNLAPQIAKKDAIIETCQKENDSL